MTISDLAVVHVIYVSKCAYELVYVIVQTKTNKP